MPIVWRPLRGQRQKEHKKRTWMRLVGGSRETPQNEREKSGAHCDEWKSEEAGNLEPSETPAKRWMLLSKTQNITPAEIYSRPVCQCVCVKVLFLNRSSHPPETRQQASCQGPGSSCTLMTKQSICSSLNKCVPVLQIVKSSAVEIEILYISFSCSQTLNGLILNGASREPLEMRSGL